MYDRIRSLLLAVLAWFFYWWIIKATLQTGNVKRQHTVQHALLGD